MEDSLEDFWNGQRACFVGRLPSTSDLREMMALGLLNLYQSACELGVNLGFMAKCFGARAPLNRIMYEILYDCWRVIGFYHHEEQVLVSCGYGSESQYLDVGYFDCVDDGIATVFEDWLADSKFVENCKEYQEQAEQAVWLLIEVKRKWDELDEALNDVLSESEGGSEIFYEEREKLQVEGDRINGAIESNAIEIGL